jgi:hypothetical protein
MSKKFFSKKRLKKIHKTLGNPAVLFVGGGVVTLTALEALRGLSGLFNKSGEDKISVTTERDDSFSDVQV